MLRRRSTPGVASVVNNTVARAAGLVAVAVLPLVAGLTGAAALEPTELAAGFRTAWFSSAAATAPRAGPAGRADHPQLRPAGAGGTAAPEHCEPAGHCALSRSAAAPLGRSPDRPGARAGPAPLVRRNVRHAGGGPR